MARQRDAKGRFVGAGTETGGKAATDGLTLHSGANEFRLLQNRTDGFSADQKAVFLEVLSETSNVKRAAAAAGIPTMTAYRHRRRHADFAAGWDKALADAIADLKMLVAHQGRFGEISDYTSRIDAEGVRHVRRRRQVAAAALRTLTLCADRAGESDAEDRAAAERREAEIEIEAATRAMMQRIRELSDDGNSEG